MNTAFIPVLAKPTSLTRVPSCPIYHHGRARCWPMLGAFTT